MNIIRIMLLQTDRYGAFRPGEVPNTRYALRMRSGCGKMPLIIPYDEGGVPHGDDPDEWRRIRMHDHLATLHIEGKVARVRPLPFTPHPFSGDYDVPTLAILSMDGRTRAHGLSARLWVRREDTPRIIAANACGRDRPGVCWRDSFIAVLLRGDEYLDVSPALGDIYRVTRKGITCGCPGEKGLDAPNAWVAPERGQWEVATMKVNCS